MTAGKSYSPDLKSRLNRRAVLKGVAGASAAAALGSTFPMPALAQETTWTLANSMRSVANPATRSRQRWRLTLFQGIEVDSVI